MGEEQRRKDSERKRLEEEKQRIENEKKRHDEERKRQEDANKRQEEENKRHAEEKKQQDLERKIQEEERKTQEQARLNNLEQIRLQEGALRQGKGEEKNLEHNKEDKTLIIEEKLENEREKKNQNQMELKKMQEGVNLSNLKEQDKIQVKENTVEGEKYNKERVTSGSLNKNMTNSRSNATLEGELVSI